MIGLYYWGNRQAFELVGFDEDGYFCENEYVTEDEAAAMIAEDRSLGLGIGIDME